MDVSEEEINWAIAIKEAAEKDGSLARISDLEYLQHAIVAKHKVHKALIRMKRLQKFKYQYGIPQIESLDEYKDDICESFRGLLQQQKGLVAGIGVDRKGRYVYVMKYSKSDPSMIQTKDDWEINMKGFYYTLLACQPTIENIRNGLVFIADCKDVGWHNFSFEVEKRSTDLYSDSFPIRFSEIVLVNTPNIIRIMYNMMKIFISKKIRKTIVMTSHDEYIQDNKHDVCRKELLPSCMGGICTNENVHEQLEHGLRERIKNNTNFKLWTGHYSIIAGQEQQPIKQQQTSSSSHDHCLHRGRRREKLHLHTLL